MARLRFDDFNSVQPASDDETQAFLESDTASDINAGDDLWNKRSGLPGLLEARNEIAGRGIIRNAQRKEYTFDPASGRYRYNDSGRLVPESIIRSAMARISNASRDDMRDITKKLNQGDISLDRWYKTMRQLMKDAYRDAWIISIGGRANYDKRQQALFGRAVKGQYKYLNNFLNDIKTGKQKLDGRAVIRAGMYGSAAKTVYQNALTAAAIGRGMKMARRIRTATESCPDCIRLGITVSDAAANPDLGYVPIAQLVPFGDSECKSHCQCYAQYKSAAVSPLTAGLTIFQGPTTEGL